MLSTGKAHGRTRAGGFWATAGSDNGVSAVDTAYFFCLNIHACFAYEHIPIDYSFHNQPTNN